MFDFRTVTPSVRRRLIHHRIPFPRTDLSLGDVVVMPFEGGENLAQFVAFAVSVIDYSSSYEAIRRIGEHLGKSTQEHATIRRVSAPLLGTAAGGLDAQRVAKELTEGFKSTAHADATLVLHALDQGVFERISAVASGAEESRATRPAERPQRDRETRSEPPPRVFVSYSHTSPDHDKWVEALATFLRENGIDARLDIWHLRHGMDLPQFMTNELILAERVVLVSDERYAEKADGRVGGVGWETMIVQGDMMQQPPQSTKYLVIVRSEDMERGLPRYLRSKFALQWPQPVADQANRQLLLRELFNIVKIPPLGARPVDL